MDALFPDDFIDRYRAGDEEAIIRLWDYGRTHCIPFICTYGLSYSDAQDIWYDAHFNFFESKLKKFDPAKGSLRAWIRTVIKHLVLYRLRKQKRFPCEPLDGYKTLPDERDSREKEGGKSDMTVLIERARRMLGNRHQLIVSLMFDEGLPIGLIAEQLGISERATRMCLQRGLERLRLISRGLKSGELPRKRRRNRRPNPCRAASP